MAKKNEDLQWGEKITGNIEYRKSSALEDGQSIVGTVVDFRDSVKFPGTINLIMFGPDGKKFSLSPSGSLKYAIKEGVFEKGKTYKIQREGTRQIKGMNSAVFGIYPSKTDQSFAPADDV
jgi:hypothetical protein